MFQWITKSEKVVFNTPIMKLVELQTESSEDARSHPFYVLRSPDWCNIIPITADGKIVLVRQFRVGNQTHTLEFPGGVMDPGESNSTITALRELLEETGYTPLENARCIHLGASDANPAIQNNKLHSLVVGPVQKSQIQNLDPGEMIEVVELSISEFVNLLKTGQFTHALMLTTFLQLLLKSGGVIQEAEKLLVSFQK